jgi:tetratricopeptide (TPR) repeat protein
MIGLALFLSTIWAQEPTEAVLKLSIERAEAERPANLHHLDSALLDLAGFFNDRGRYREAEPLYLRSCSINEKLYGPSSLETARSLARLGALLHAELRFDEAEVASRKAAEMIQSLSGPDSIDSAYAMANLAVALADQGRYARAEPTLRRSLFLIRRSIPEPDAKAVAVIEENLAMVYLRQGEFLNAEPLLEDAVRTFGSLKPVDSLAHANACAGLAELLVAERRWTEAAALIEQAYRVALASQNEDHPWLAGILHIKASVEAHSGNLREAALDMKRCIELLETRAGPQSARLADMLDDDAVILRRLGRSPEARADRTRAKAIRRVLQKQ